MNGSNKPQHDEILMAKIMKAANTIRTARDLLIDAGFELERVKRAAENGPASKELLALASETLGLSRAANRVVADLSSNADRLVPAGAKELA